MAESGMLKNASELAAQMRELGVKVFHAPISFAPDGTDNPNKNLGILAGCDSDKLFVRWPIQNGSPLSTVRLLKSLLFLTEVHGTRRYVMR